MEEIGARATFFELSSFGQDKKKYLYWLLEQVTAPKTKPETVLTDAAAALLCEKLTTPLQFEAYLTQAFVEAFGVGQKPVDADTIKDILAPDLEGLEARLARSGYDVKQLTDILTAKPKEIRAFLSGHLPPEPNAGTPRSIIGGRHTARILDSGPYFSFSLNVVPGGCYRAVLN